MTSFNLKKTALASAVFLGLTGMAHADPILWVSGAGGSIDTVDVATGVRTAVGNTGVGFMTDLAFSPTGELYGTSFTDLYKINTLTGAATLIGSTGRFSNALVFGADGTLYAQDYGGGTLFKINTTTGAGTVIGSNGYVSSGDLAFIGSDLYLSAQSGPNDVLVKLDPLTGAGTLVGDIGYGAVFGLATPDNINLYGLSGNNILNVNPLTGVGTLSTTMTPPDYEAYGTTFFREAGAVPEPESLGLILLGMLATTTALRRRRQSV
ncbi:MAG: PEP-CTERM sorting domain-containing protein [Burkholderiaceae bacterium]